MAHQSSQHLCTLFNLLILLIFLCYNFESINCFRVYNSPQALDYNPTDYQSYFEGQQTKETQPEHYDDNYEFYDYRNGYDYLDFQVNTDAIYAAFDYNNKLDSEYTSRPWTFENDAPQNNYKENLIHFKPKSSLGYYQQNSIERQSGYSKYQNYPQKEPNLQTTKPINQIPLVVLPPNRHSIIHLDKKIIDDVFPMKDKYYYYRQSNELPYKVDYMPENKKMPQIIGNPCKANFPNVNSQKTQAFPAQNRACGMDILSSKSTNGPGGSTGSPVNDVIGTTTASSIEKDDELITDDNENDKDDREDQPGENEDDNETTTTTKPETDEDDKTETSERVDETNTTIRESSNANNKTQPNQQPICAACLFQAGYPSMNPGMHPYAHLTHQPVTAGYPQYPVPTHVQPQTAYYNNYNRPTVTYSNQPSYSPAQYSTASYSFPNSPKLYEAQYHLHSNKLPQQYSPPKYSPQQYQSQSYMKLQNPPSQYSPNNQNYPPQQYYSKPQQTLNFNSKLGKNTNQYDKNYEKMQSTERSIQVDFSFGGR